MPMLFIMKACDPTLDFRLGETFSEELTLGLESGFDGVFSAAHLDVLNFWA